MSNLASEGLSESEMAAVEREVKAELRAQGLGPVSEVEAIVEEIVEPALDVETEVAIDEAANEVAVQEVMQELAAEGLSEAELAEAEIEIKAELEGFHPILEAEAEEAAIEEAVLEIAVEQGLTAEEAAGLKEELIV